MCSCGMNHDELKADAVLWSSLVYVGIQRIEADETGPAEAYELRNCAAGSTLAKEVKP